MSNIVEEYQNKLANLLITDEGNIKEKIDKFVTTEVNDLSEYWNQSVKDFKDKLENILANEQPGEKLGGNAGESFDIAPPSDGAWVRENKNLNSETYSGVRGDDKIYSVLNDEEKLDFTIGNESKTGSELSSRIREVMLRLLMPQYERRVEIEDLNRNFWVIGQNLTALNKLLSDLVDGLIPDLIAELCGEWDNIYRIWQALMFLENQINNLDFGEKLRIKMQYGYGNNLDNHKDGVYPKYTLFTKENACYYGIAPYIRKTKTENGWVYHVHYNERLQEIDNKSNEELFKEFTTVSPLISFDSKISHRNIKAVLETIKQRNFCLVAFCKTDKFAALNSAKSPFTSALSFYRNYILTVLNADNIDTELNNVAGNDQDWERVGILKTTTGWESRDYNIDSSIIPDNVINSFRVLSSFLRQKEYSSFDCLLNAICNLEFNSTIADLRNCLSKYKLGVYVADFFNICKILAEEINFTSPLEQDSDDIWAVSAENMSSFCSTLKAYEEEYSLDGKGTFSGHFKIADPGDENHHIEYGKYIPLPFVNWDLVSFASDIPEDGGTQADIGQLYWYKTKTTNGSPYRALVCEDHLWIDFVESISRDSWIRSNSTIGSVSLLETREHLPFPGSDMIYDTVITTPLNKAVSTGSGKDIKYSKYEDFVRLCKPYPNLLTLTQDTVHEIYWLDNEDMVNGFGHGRNAIDDIAHLLELNNNDNWIGLKRDGVNYYPCIDGFFGFSSMNDHYAEKSAGGSENIIANNSNRLYSLENLLGYSVATSDMIDCTHDVKGQSKLINQHNYEDPVVNLRFLNGKTQRQEVEIVVSKDNTTAPLRVKEPEINITETSIANIVKIGDFYWDGLNLNNLERVGQSDVLDSSTYNIETYGLGAYAVPKGKLTHDVADSINVKYVDYNTKSWKSRTECTAINLRNWGKQYIEELIRDGTIEKRGQLIATKIGTNYWRGDAGSQWGRGQFCDLFWFDGNETVLFLSQLNLNDGFWDLDAATLTAGKESQKARNIFRTFQNAGAKRFRRVNFVFDSIQATYEDGELQSVTGIGQLRWYDRYDSNGQLAGTSNEDLVSITGVKLDQDGKIKMRKLTGKECEDKIINGKDENNLPTTIYRNYDINNNTTPRAATWKISDNTDNDYQPFNGGALLVNANPVELYDIIGKADNDYVANTYRETNVSLTPGVMAQAFRGTLI